MSKIALKLVLVASTLAFALAANAANPSSQPTQKAKPHKTNESALAAEVELLKSEVSSLQTSVLQLEFARNDSAYLDPSAPNKYSRADSNNGSFIISIDNIQPYVDGQKVTLDIGNLFDASYTGFSLTVVYGPRMPTDPAGMTDWNKSLKKLDQDFTQTLYAGTWNKIDVVLAPLKAEEFGYLNIVIHTNQISLRTYPANGN